MLDGGGNFPVYILLQCLTSQVSKLMESLVRGAVVKQLQDHKLINDTQHRFVNKKSLAFLEKVTKYVDEGYPVDRIYLDFSKAIDKVSHKRLIKE